MKNFFKSIKRDSWYAIVGVVLAVVAILLDVFVWHNAPVFWIAFTCSLGIGGMLALYIGLTETDYTPLFWDHTIKGIPAPIGALYVLGIALINFAVVLVATVLFKAFVGFIVGWIVWTVMMVIMECTRTKYPNPSFWILIGFAMYLVSWFTPSLIAIFFL